MANDPPAQVQQKDKKKYAKEEEEEVLFLSNKLLAKHPTLLDCKHFGYRAVIRLRFY